MSDSGTFPYDSDGWVRDTEKEVFAKLQDKE